MNISREVPSNKSELLELYKEEGWISYTKDEHLFWIAIEASLDHFCAIENEKLIGYARVLGDGIHSILVQDLIVKKELRNKKIGSKLIDAILNYYQEVRQIIVLCDNEEGLNRFYITNGLKECNEYGCKCYIKLK